MGIKKDYEAMHHTLLLKEQRIRDLEEEINEKNDVIEKKRAEGAHTEDLMRDLCTSILAKDRSEMVLGKSYTWRKIPIDELITKAKNSYKAYTLERARILGETLDLAETRRQEAESLADQLSQLMQNANLSGTDSEIVQDAQKSVDKIKAPNALKEAAETGGVQMVVEDDKDALYEANGEMKTMEELMDIAESVAISSNAVPVVPSSKKNDRLEQARENAMLAHVVDLKKYMDDFNDEMWAIVEIIGSLGIPKYNDIEAKIKEKYDMKDSKIRTAIKALSNTRVVSQLKVNLPLSPNVFLFTLTDIGQRIYKTKFGKKPVQNELDRVIAEHDNAEHGYGILDIEKVLKEKGYYQEISSFNRSNPIQLGNGKSFIPDLICKRGKFTEYIEYERGHHTQNDFNAKCNKMAQVTRYLNFVVPNQDTVKTLMRQIDSWAEKRGQKSLEGIKVRLTTSFAIRKSDEKGINWIIEYDFKQGLKPVKIPEDFA